MKLKQFEKSEMTRDKILAAAVEEFAAMIAEHTSTPIEFYDERLSTVSAHRFLSEGMGVKAKKHKNIVDSLAAEIILQSYMDSKKKTNLS